MKFVDSKKVDEIFGIEDYAPVDIEEKKEEANGADWLKELDDFKELNEGVNEVLEGDGDEDSEKNRKRREAVGKIAGKFSDMLQKQLEEKGEEGLIKLMWLMQIATEGLIIDYERGGFEEFADLIKEEDVYRLRRFVRDALDAKKGD